MEKQKIENNWKVIRKAKGLRQADVAKAMGLVSTDRISEWENGLTYPHIVNLAKLCRLYGAKVEEVYVKLFGPEGGAEAQVEA